VPYRLIASFSGVLRGGEAVGRTRTAAIGGLALLMTAVVLSWNLARPAFWIDESASVAATRRTWPHLFTLLHGPEAPLVPYYVILKPLAALGSDVGLPLEATYRWPSVVAIALAAGFLTAWVTRYAGTALSLATLAVLLLSAGISRYGQEARPYAFTALFAVLATIAWFRLREARSRRPRVVAFVLYALAVAGLACLHLLAATLVIAHLVASAVLSSTRLRELLLVAASALAGAVVSAPATVIGALNAKGPGTPAPVTAQRLGQTLVQAFTWPAPFLNVGWVLLLCAAGMFGLLLSRYRTITVIALCWALVPLAVLVPAIIVRPTLLRLRYLVFVIPGWALLGGLGVVVLATVAARALRRVSTQASAPAFWAVGLALVVALGFAQWSSLTEVRSPAGHGEDVRPAIAFIEGNPAPPLMISGRTAGSVLTAYRPALGRRLLAASLQYDGRTIWPDVSSVADRRHLLRGHNEIVVLVRNTLNQACRRQGGEKTAAFVQRCMPRPLAALGYRVVKAGGAGRNYAAAVVSLKR
jgi:hypothetical protein